MGKNRNFYYHDNNHVQEQKPDLGRSNAEKECKVIHNGNVNIRLNPAPDAIVVTIVPQGERFNVVAEDVNGYVEVENLRYHGFIRKDLVRVYDK